jgi:ribosomal protein L11 methyltransferase
VPYRIDLRIVERDTLDRLIELGAIDAELSDEGGLAALMPDRIPPAEVASALGVADVEVSPAIGRDAASVWVLSPRPLHLERLGIRLTDAPAFGTGLHPTTSLCLDALEEIVPATSPERVLDVGTGSGVLALAALRLGVPYATAIDVDDEALRAAAENARVNGLSDRLRVERGGPDVLTGMWPLVVANILAAPLIEMSPALVRRVAHHGELVLSGIPASVEQEVDRAYARVGMRHVRAMSRDGWAALVLQASW